MISHGAYELSYEQDRLQMDVIHGFLSTCYWSPGIRMEKMEKGIRNSLAVGAYLGREQVGFARLITDRASFGYLADVFVLDPHRGHGLAKAMTRALLEHPETRELRRVMLATRDAHGVYAACGFTPLDTPERFMQIHRPLKPE
jgi:GNAT superfamily N-acetyltransferase